MKILMLILLAGFAFFMINGCGEQKDETQPAIEHDLHGGHDHGEMTDSETETTEPANAEEDTSSDYEFEPVAVPVAVEGTKAKPFKGKVLNLQNIVIGGSGMVNQQEADKLVAQGQLLVVKSGNDIFFVYNSGGTYAGKALSKYAGKDVGLIGKSKMLGDLKIFIADDIVPL